MAVPAPKRPNYSLFPAGLSSTERTAGSTDPESPPERTSSTASPDEVLAVRDSSSEALVASMSDKGNVSPDEPNAIQASNDQSIDTAVDESQDLASAPRRTKAPPSALPIDGPPKIMQSMFPTYDTDKSLTEQHYLPSQMSPTHLPYESVCKSPYSPDFNRVNGDADDVGLLFKAIGTFDRDCTPQSDVSSMWSLWSRPKEFGPAPSYRLQMHVRQPDQSRRSLIPRSRKKSTIEPLLTFGPSLEHPVISLSDDCAASSSRGGHKRWPKYTLRKHTLSRFDELQRRSDVGELLSEFKLKPTNGTDAEDSWLESLIRNEDDSIITSITPHAALRTGLLQDYASSPVSWNGSDAADGERFSDGTEWALNSIGQRHTCRLRFTTLPLLREQSYVLRHPTLGILRLKTTGDVRLPHTLDARAHPSIPPGSITLLAPVQEDSNLPSYSSPLASPMSMRHRTPEIALASLDLESSHLFLDGSALSDLVTQEPYIVDIAVSSLVAVLIAETSKPRLSQRMCFAPPPTQAVSELKGRRRMTLVGPKRQTQKMQKVGRREKVTGEMETALTTGFAALAVALSFAVESLGKAVERAQSKEQEGMMPLAA